MKGDQAPSYCAHQLAAGVLRSQDVPRWHAVRPLKGRPLEARKQRQLVHVRYGGCQLSALLAHCRRTQGEERDGGWGGAWKAVQGTGRQISMLWKALLCDP